MTRLTEALEFYGDPDGYTGHEQSVLAAARAWLSTPTEPTEAQVEAANRAAVSAWAKMRAFPQHFPEDEIPLLMVDAILEALASRAEETP